MSAWDKAKRRWKMPDQQTDQQSTPSRFLGSDPLHWIGMIVGLSIVIYLAGCTINYLAGEE